MTYVGVPLMSYYVNPKSVTASSRRDASLALSELLRAFRQNIEELQVSGRFGTDEWDCAARNAPIDRLMSTVLALHLETLADVSVLRRRLTRILVDRSRELHGVKRIASGVFGTAFWRLAGLEARRIATRRREGHQTADFDSQTAKHVQ